MPERPSPLTVWAVSDGRAGIAAQALGLAEAVARLRPAEITVKHIAWRGGLGRLPWRANLLPHLTLAPGSGIAPPWPDIWIAAGRATLPLSTRMRRWSQGRTFVVQTQDPRTSLGAFDLVIPPTHDQLEGDNVFPILGAPNRLTPERLARDRALFAARIDPLPRPHIAVIVGGASKTFNLPQKRAAAMGDEIVRAAEAVGGSLLVSFTRRTPEAARRILAARLADRPGWIWDGTGENPYFAFLASADAVMVTEDSTNLATDAAATGKAVHILPMSGQSAKFARFHAELQARGVALRFNGALDDGKYPPLFETERAAHGLLRRFDAQKRHPR